MVTVNLNGKLMKRNYNSVYLDGINVFEIIINDYSNDY